MPKDKYLHIRIAKVIKVLYFCFFLQKARIDPPESILGFCIIFMHCVLFLYVVHTSSCCQYNKPCRRCTRKMSIIRYLYVNLSFYFYFKVCIHTHQKCIISINFSKMPWKIFLQIKAILSWLFYSWFSFICKFFSRFMCVQCSVKTKFTLVIAYSMFLYSANVLL